METLVFAGDESGDVSFNFGKGASRYFVVAVIGTPEARALRQALEEVRRELSLPAHVDSSGGFSRGIDLRRDAQGESEAFEMIQSKMRVVLEFNLK